MPSGSSDVPVVSHAEIAARLDKLDAKAALKQAFLGLAGGNSVQPPQTLALFPNEAGDFICYLGILADQRIFGAKLSPYIVELARQGETPVTAYTLLMSMDTGRPLLLCDSLALTAERTAATTSLALDYLMPADPEKLAVIGAGSLARRHLHYVARQCPWHEIAVYAPSLADGSAAGHAAKREAIEATGGRVRIAATAEQAVRDADVVLLCTSSGTPVIETAWLKDGATVTSIATNAPRAHGIDPSTLAELAVFCDYRMTAPLAAGEMVIAREQHGWSDDRIVADLPELVAGHHAGAGSESGRRYFRSIGLGIEDLAIAALLL